MACRMAGRVEWGGGEWPFFPRLGLPQAPVLEKGKGDHGQERRPVKPDPGAPLEVVEPEVLFELLAGPARLDSGGKRPEIRVGIRFDR